VVASLSPCIVFLGVPYKNSSLGSSFASGCSWVKPSGDGVSTVSDNLKKHKNKCQTKYYIKFYMKSQLETKILKIYLFLMLPAASHVGL
jgi:hypothetical protein